MFNSEHVACFAQSKGGSWDSTAFTTGASKLRSAADVAECRVEVRNACISIQRRCSWSQRFDNKLLWTPSTVKSTRSLCDSWFLSYCFCVFFCFFVLFCFSIQPLKFGIKVSKWQNKYISAQQRTCCVCRLTHWDATGLHHVLHECDKATELAVTCDYLRLLVTTVELWDLASKK